MGTATKTVERTRQARGMRADGALDMTRGKGENTHTYYQPGIVEQARTEKVGIRIIKNGRTLLTAPRMVHREDLTAVYSEPHDEAGSGKYINISAIDGDTVTGVQNVNPYLAEDGSYATLVQALQSFCQKSAMAELTGTIRKSRLDGQHIEWKGKASTDEAILVGQWVTAEQLWERALLINPQLKTMLRQNQSQVKGVKAHLGVFEKFTQNLDVIRRARNVFHVASGEVDKDRGGATPYAMPLEQCGFAIDKFYLTTGFDADGNETGEYFYRLAIGRGTPWTLTFREWRGLDAGTPYAYLNEKVMARAKSKKPITD